MLASVFQEEGDVIGHHQSLLRHVSITDCQRQHIIRSAARAAANAAALSEKPLFSARSYKHLHKFLPVEVGSYDFVVPILRSRFSIAIIPPDTCLFGAHLAPRL